MVLFVIIVNAAIGFYYRECPHHHHILILIIILLVLILILLHILLLLLLLQPDDVYKPAGAEVRGASKSRGGGARPREGRSFLIVMLVMLTVIGHQCPSCDFIRRCMRQRETHVNKKL